MYEVWGTEAQQNT